MRSKKYTSYLIGCLIGLSLLMVACDKRHKPDLTNIDQKADADETVNGNNIPATQGNAGDSISNNNPTIDLNPTTEVSTTGDNEDNSATQSDCNRGYSGKCASTGVTTTSTVAGASGSDVTLASGLIFFKPTKPAVVRCGSLISRKIGSAYCDVNNFTGASQPLGMVMKMKNAYGTTGPACPKVCMCTGENIEMSGWHCQQLPEAQSYKVLIQGCGSRIKTFYRGTEDETTCAVNKNAAIDSSGTVKGMELLVGKKSICEDASCVCKGKVTLNRKYAGWRCGLSSEISN